MKYHYLTREDELIDLERMLDTKKDLVWFYSISTIVGNLMPNTF